MDGARFESLHVGLIGEVETALRALTPPADARPARLHAAMVGTLTEATAEVAARLDGVMKRAGLIGNGKKAKKKAA